MTTSLTKPTVGPGFLYAKGELAPVKVSSSCKAAARPLGPRTIKGKSYAAFEIHGNTIVQPRKAVGRARHVGKGATATSASKRLRSKASIAAAKKALEREYVSGSGRVAVVMKLSKEIAAAERVSQADVLWAVQRKHPRMAPKGGRRGKREQTMHDRHGAIVKLGDRVVLAHGGIEPGIVTKIVRSPDPWGDMGSKSDALATVAVGRRKYEVRMEEIALSSLGRSSRRKATKGGRARHAGLRGNPREGYVRSGTGTYDFEPAGPFTENGRIKGEYTTLELAPGDTLKVWRVRVRGGYTDTGEYVGVGAPMFLVENTGNNRSHAFRAKDYATAKKLVREGYPTAKIAR